MTYWDMMRDAKQNDILLPWAQARTSITTSHMHTKGAPSGSALPVTILHNFISSLLNVICLPPWSYKLHAISSTHSSFFWQLESVIGFSPVCLCLSRFVLAMWWLKRNTIGPRVLLCSLHSSITSRAFWAQSSYKQLMPLSYSTGCCSV